MEREKQGKFLSTFKLFVFAFFHHSVHPNVRVEK